jgi:CP family cyanate transporter-like MFS transporter
VTRARAADSVVHSTALSTPASRRSTFPVLLAAVVLAGLNLRTVFASLPPLLTHVRADLGLSASVAGLLTTGPVVCFGLFALLAPRLARRFAVEWLLVAATAATAAGTAIRGVGGAAGLFGGTILAGVAIAVAQALVPVLVRLRFPARAGTLTAAFSTALTLGSAVAAGLAVPLAHVLGGWRGALAAFAVPAAAASFVWLVPAAEERTRLPAAEAPPLHRLPRAWSVALYFGLQSMAFYSGLTWLPTILEHDGFSAAGAGALQALANAVQFVPAFAVPVLAGRRRHQTRALVGLVLPALAALGGLIAAPGAAVLWMALLGVAQGGALGLALILPVLRGATGPAVAALTAMALSVGYLLASVGPFAAGLAHDLTGGWNATLVFLLGVTLAELPLGIAATRGWKV